MKSRCSLGRVILASWCLMLCLGFVIATSLEVTAAPLGDALQKVGECQNEIAACQANCSASGLPPQAVANCKSDCSRLCQTGQAIKPSNNLQQLPPRTSLTPTVSGQTAVFATPPPIGPPDPVAPVKELPIHLLITNLRDAQGNNIGVRGQIDRVVALVNANMAQQTSVRAKLIVESFTVFGPSMSATTFMDRPNHRFVRIPYMVGYKIYDVQKKVAGSWVSTGVTRNLSQSINIHTFCDRWETGKGSLMLTTKIDRPFIESNQGIAEQIVDFFLNGYLTDYIDGVVRQQIASIPLSIISINLNLDCNALGRDAGAANHPNDDLVLYSYGQSILPGLKGQTVLGQQLSLTLQSIKRLPARDLSGQPLYAASEAPVLDVFANQHSARIQLPTLMEGQQVPVNAAPIVVPMTGLTSLNVLMNIQIPNLAPSDSASRVYGSNVNFGNGTQTIKVPKSYVIKADPKTGAKPQQILVDAYEVTFRINSGGLVADPGLGTNPTPGTVKPGILNQTFQGTILRRGVEGGPPENSTVETAPTTQEGQAK